MSYEIKGTLYRVFPTESKTDSFQAREFVITTKDNSYTNFIKFQLTQDRCSLIDSFKPEDEIKVHFDLRGREWQDKYFTNLNAWRIEAAADAPAPNASETTDVPMPTEESSDFLAEDFGDDLPF